MYRSSQIPIFIQEQPDDSTCGPTALQSVYSYFGHDVSTAELIESVSSFKDGGTLAVMLGIDALKRGYKAELLSYNLKVFDPSWWGLNSEELIEKLELQLKHKDGKRFTASSRSYIEYLKLGGKIIFRDLSESLLDEYFTKKLPILTGLSSTYLYRSPRELIKTASTSTEDDIRGEPCGHFVVLCGRKENAIQVADPYAKNPLFGQHYYAVEANHLLHSILLGIVTYDANMLVVWPEEYFL